MPRFKEENGNIVSFVKQGVTHDVEKTIDEYKKRFDEYAPSTQSRLAVRAAVQIVEAMVARLAACEAALGIGPDTKLPDRLKPATKVRPVKAVAKRGAK